MFPIISNFQTIMGKAHLFLRAETGLLADDIVVLVYNQTLSQDSIPATGDFAVAGTGQTISDVGIFGSTVRITMTADLLTSDVLTVSYTKGSNPIQDSSVNESVDLVTESVVNHIALPAFLSAEIGRYDDRSVIILMDHNLDETSIPLVTDFAVDDGAANAVTKVTIVGMRIYLELTNIIDTGDTVTVGYTQPASNRITDYLGREAATFTPQSVTNNV